MVSKGLSINTNTYNIELIIAIIIMIALLLFGYNKCVEKYENNDQNQNQNNFIMYQAPSNVKISINNSSVKLSFSINIDTENPMIPKGFFIILVQYDKTFTITGNNKFFLSNETEINISNVKNKDLRSVCTTINGIPTCEYTFENIEIVDVKGDPFYYKIGVAAIYENGNSSFSSPYNVNSVNKLFSLNKNIDDQNSLYSDFIKYRDDQEKIKQSTSLSNSELLSSADGQYEFLKSQIGGYPDNLFIDDDSHKKYTLNNLVDKSMSEGILNISVS